MTFADYRGRYVGCNPVEVGAAAEDIIGEREALLREALVAISNPKPAEGCCGAFP